MTMGCLYHDMVCSAGADIVVAERDFTITVRNIEHIFRESIGTHPDDVIVVGRPSAAAKKYESKGGRRKRRFMFLR